MHLLFAWRYFKAKKTTNAINIIAWTSVAAIIIGTTALVLVLSVFNGFEGLVKSLYSSFYTDLKVMPVSGKLMTLSSAQLQKIKAIPGIRNFSLVLEEKAFLQTKTRQFGEEDGERENQKVVQLKGVDKQYRYVTGVAGNLFKGEFVLGDRESPQMIIGAGVERTLDIDADNHLDPLVVYLPRKDGTEQLDPLESISSSQVTVSGGFMVQQDFDNTFCITNIDFLRNALKLKDDQYSAVEIAVTDPATADDIQQKIKHVLGDKYEVLNKYQQNKSLYAVMNMERWAIYGVLSLILVVAAFTMIGALTMLVLEKQKDISVLHALGAGRSFIQKIFLNEGMLLALIGGGIGMLLALLIAVLQINFHLIPLTGGSFLIDYFPVQLRIADFLLVGATVFIIALLASWFPSRKAALQQFSLKSE